VRSQRCVSGGCAKASKDVSIYLKTHKLLQVCKQVVTNLFTNSDQIPAKASVKDFELVQIFLIRVFVIAR
jgi:hypothetical protein